MRRDGNDVYAVNSMSFHPQFGTFVTAGSDGGRSALTVLTATALPSPSSLAVALAPLAPGLTPATLLAALTQPAFICSRRLAGAYNFWDKDSKQRLKAMQKCSMPIPCGDFNRQACCRGRQPCPAYLLAGAVHTTQRPAHPDRAPAAPPPHHCPPPAGMAASMRTRCRTTGRAVTASTTPPPPRTTSCCTRRRRPR